MSLKLMPDRVVKDHDLLNRMLTWGLDEVWRRFCVKELVSGEVMVDLCCGTGELALYTSNCSTSRAFVIGLDFSKAMLKRAMRKKPVEKRKTCQISIGHDKLSVNTHDMSLDAVKSRRKLSSGENIRRIVLIALFGVAIFTSKAFLPSPMDKMAVAVQALFLALGSLLSRRFGATSVAAIGAALTILLRPSLAPLTIAFALIYGLLTDGFTFILHVKAAGGDVSAKRLVAAVTMSTAITGLASYYTTVHILALLTRNPVLEVIILITGVISGLFGGFLATLVWRRALRHMVAMSSLETE